MFIVHDYTTGIFFTEEDLIDEGPYFTELFFLQMLELKTLVQSPQSSIKENKYVKLCFQRLTKEFHNLLFLT